MIEKVSNLTKKSFKNYTGPNDKFKQKNIVFAYNGKGKSSLADGIIEEFVKDSSKNKESYRIYNRDYVSKNLVLEEDNSKLRGIVANFSQEDTDIEKKIKLLQNEIKETKQQKLDIDNAKKVIEDECSNILNNRKGSLKIQKKSIDITKPKDTLKSYISDLENAKKVESNEEELLKIKGTTNFDEQLETITNIPIATIPTLETHGLDNDYINEIEDICNKTYINDINIPAAQVIYWLNEGMKIHTQEDKNCKFCGGTLHFESIKSKISIYNNNEKQKATMSIVTFIDILQEINNELNGTINERSSAIAILGEEVKEEFDLLAKVDLQNYINIIQNKILSMNTIIAFEKTTFFNYINIIKNFNTKIDSIKKEKMKSIIDRQNKQDVLVKGAIGLEIINNSLIREKLSSIEQKQSEIIAIENKNNENNKEITELRDSKSPTKDFADYINTILLNIGIQLKLILDGKDYILKHINEDIKLTIKDISEGELNLLALLFFYYELFNDSNQVELKSNIDLIVIGDPMSSVDHINKMFILSLINSLLDKVNAQIFVLTHIWEDFYEFCYSRKDKSDTPFRFFEIKKAEVSSIEKVNSNQTPYRHHFKEIYDFSNKGNSNNLTDCEIYHMPNIMRKVLEEFLKFKASNCSPTKANINNIRIALCGNNITTSDELSISTLLNVCNIDSRECSRNPDEILSSSKFLMKCIKNIDEQHFNTMKA